MMTWAAFRDRFAELEAAAEWESLTDLLSARADAAPAQERPRLLLTRAEIEAARLRDTSRARRTWTEAMQAADDTAFRVLLELALRDTAAPCAEPFLRVGIDRVTDRNERLALLEALTEAPAFGHDAADLPLLSEMLRETSTVGFARQAIERLAGDGDDRAASLLEETARATGDRRGLLAQLERRLAATAPHTEEFGGLFEEILDIGRRLNGPDDVADRFHAAMDRYPGAERQLLQVLERSSHDDALRVDLQEIGYQLADASGDLDALLRRTDALARLRGGEHAAGLHLRAASLMQERGLPTERVLQRLEAAVAAAPEVAPQVEQTLRSLQDSADPDLVDAIVSRRRALLERMGDTSGVYDVMRIEKDAARDDHERARRLIALGRFESERLGRPDLAVDSFAGAGRIGDDTTRDEAIRALTELLTDNRVEDDAVRELAELLQAAERWDDLIRLRERQVTRAADEEEAGTAHFELARLIHQVRNDAATAAGHAAEAARLVPSRLAWVQAAGALLRECGQNEAALPFLEHEVGLTQDVHQRTQLRLGVARFRADALGDIPGAVATIIRDIGTDDQDVSDAINTLLARPGAAEAAEEIAVALVEAGQTARGAAILSVAGAAIAWDGPVGTRLGLRAFQLGALRTDDVHRLEASVRQHGNPEDLTTFLMLRASATAEPTERAHVLEALAGQFAATGDWERAAQLHAQLVEADPARADHRDRLIVALSNLPGREADLLAAIDDALDAADADDTTRAAWLERQRDLFDVVAGRPDLAIAAATRVATMPGDDRGAEAWIRARCAELGDLAMLADALRAIASSTADPTDRARRELELGELAFGRLGQPARALDHLLAAADAPELPADDRRRAASLAVEAAVARNDAEAAGWALDALFAATDPADRSALLGNLVEIGGEPIERMAIERLVRADQGVSRDILARRVALADRWGNDNELGGALADLYRFEADALSDEQRLQLALWWLENDPDAAWELITRALCGDPADADMQAFVTRYGTDPARRIALADTLAAARPDSIPALHFAADLLASDRSTGPRREAAWRAILLLDRTDQRALDQLVHAFEGRKAVDELRDFLAERRGSAEDPEYVRLTAHLARLAPDPEAARALWQEVADRDATDVESRRVLARMAEGAQEWQRAADLLVEAVAHESDPAARRQDRKSIVRLLTTRLNDRTRAAKILEDMLDEDPLDEDTLSRLERIRRMDRDWAGLVTVLQRKATLASDIEARLAIWREAAEIAETKAMDDERTALFLSRILDIEPKNLAIIERLAAVFERMERWDDFLSALERLAAAAITREIQAEVFVRAAGVLHEKLGRHADAFVLLVRAAESVPPAEPQILAMRASVAAADREDLWRQWAGVLRWLAGRSRERERADAFLVELADVVDARLDDPTSALGVLREAFESHPRRGPVLEAMERIAAARDMRTALAAVYKRLQEAAPSDHEAQWHAFCESARLAEKEVNRPDMAFDIFLRAASDERLRDRAEPEMARLANDHRLWEPWIDYLGGRIRHEPTPESIPSVLEKARVQRDELHDWAAAFETLAGGLRNIDDDGRIREALYALTERHDAWDALIEVLETLAEISETSRRIDVLLEIAEIHRTHRREALRAFEVTRDAWRLRPLDPTLREKLGDAAAPIDAIPVVIDLYIAAARSADMREDRRAYLEGARDIALTARSADDLTRVQSAWALTLPEDTAWIDDADAAFASLDARPRLVDALMAVAAEVRAEPLRAEILVRAGEIATTVDRAADAEEAFGAACRLQSTGDTRNRGLAGLETMGAWEALYAVRALDLLDARDEAARASLVEEVRRITLDKLGDAEFFRVALSRALEQTPGSDALQRSLIEHLRASENWEELADRLAERAKLRPDEARELLIEACSVSDEHLGDARRCLRYADAILRTNDSDNEALGLKASALASLGRWREHIEVVARLAGQLDGEAAASAWSSAAQAAEQHVGDRAQALGFWRKAAEANPSDSAAMIEVGRLSADAGSGDATSALREALAIARRSSGAQRAIANAAWQLARSLGTAPGERDEVELLLREVLHIDPRHRDAREHLVRLLDDQRRPADVLDVLDGELAAAANEDERTFALARRAAVLFFDLDRRDEAASAVDAALALDPASYAANGVRADIALATGRFDEALEIYPWLLEHVDAATPDRAPRFSRVLAGEHAGVPLTTIWTTRLARALELSGRSDEAFEHFASLNLDDDRWAPALAGLARICVERGNLPAASVYIDTFLDVSADLPPEDRWEILSLAGRVAESEGRVGDAETFFQDALDAGGHRARDAGERAVRLALRRLDRPRAIAVLRRMLELATIPEERADYLTRIGDLLVQSSGASEEAAACYREAFDTAPAGSPLAERALEQLTAISPEDERLALLEQVAREATPERRLAALLQHGDAYFARNPSDPDAAARYAEALRLDPTSAVALEKALRAHTASGQPAELAALLESQLARIPEEAVAQRAQLRRALADVLVHQLGRPSDALPHVRAILNVLPNDVRSLELLFDVVTSEDAEDPDEALRVAAHLVRMGVLTENLLRGLEATHAGANNIDGVLQALVILRLVGRATPREIDLLDQLPWSRPAFEPGDLVGRIYRDVILPPAPNHEIVARVLSEATDAVLTREPVRARDELDAVAPDRPIARITTELSVAFRMERPDLLIDPAQTQAVVPTASRPLTLLVSPTLANETNERVLRFEIARALALAQPEYLMAGILPPSEYLGFFEAAIGRVVADDATADESLAERKQQWSRRIGALPPVPDVSPLPRVRLPSVGTWRDLATVVGIRSGLLACFDTRTAWDILLREAGRAAPGHIDELRDLIDEKTTLRALIAFVLSDDYLRARRTLGLTWG